MADRRSHWVTMGSESWTLLPVVILPWMLRAQGMTTTSVHTEANTYTRKRANPFKCIFSFNPKRPPFWVDALIIPVFWKVSRKKLWGTGGGLPTPSKNLEAISESCESDLSPNYA